MKRTLPPQHDSLTLYPGCSEPCHAPGPGRWEKSVVAADSPLDANHRGRLSGPLKFLSKPGWYVLSRFNVIFSSSSYCSSRDKSSMGLLFPGKDLSGFFPSLPHPVKSHYVLSYLMVSKICDLVTYLACSWHQRVNYNLMTFCIPTRSRRLPTGLTHINTGSLLSTRNISSNPEASPVPLAK